MDEMDWRTGFAITGCAGDRRDPPSPGRGEDLATAIETAWEDLVEAGALHDGASTSLGDWLAARGLPARTDELDLSQQRRVLKRLHWWLVGQGAKAQRQRQAAAIDTDLTTLANSLRRTFAAVADARGVDAMFVAAVGAAMAIALERGAGAACVETLQEMTGVFREKAEGGGQCPS